MEINYPQVDAYLSKSLGKPVIGFDVQQFDDDEGKWVEIDVCEDFVPREMGLQALKAASIATVTITFEEFTRIIT